MTTRTRRNDETLDTPFRLADDARALATESPVTERPPTDSTTICCPAPPDDLGATEAFPASGVFRRPVSHGDADRARRAMYEAFHDGDYIATAARAHDLLARDPDDFVAEAILAQCSAPTGLLSVPVPSLSTADLHAVDVDPRSAYLLRRIDGRSSVEALVDASGLPPGETLHLLGGLVAKGVVRLAQAS